MKEIKSISEPKKKQQQKKQQTNETKTKQQKQSLNNIQLFIFYRMDPIRIYKSIAPKNFRFFFGLDHYSEIGLFIKCVLIIIYFFPFRYLKYMYHGIAFRPPNILNYAKFRTLKKIYLDIVSMNIYIAVIDIYSLY